MEVNFTPEQEARITQTAKASGIDAAELVKDAALQFVDDANFRAAVMEGKPMPTGESSSRKTRWTGALNRCYIPDAHPVDTARSTGLGGY